MAIDYNKSLFLDLTTGMVALYPAGSAPSGWALCDGASYDGTTATYLGLWNVTGVTYGGTGQSSFKVPDFRDRLAIGKSGANSLGQTSKGITGGPSTTSTSNESAFHTHGANTGWMSADHYHTADKSGSGWTSSWGQGNDHTHAFTTSGVSVNHTHSQSHTHQTPDLVLNYIIKL